MNMRLHPLYVLMGDPAETLEHGQQWLTALTRCKAGKEVLDGLGALRAIDKDILVEDGESVLPLGEAAVKKRKFDITVNLLRGFDKRFHKLKTRQASIFSMRI